MDCECWLTRGRHDCVCCRIKWRGFCTAGACCVEDGCVLSYQRGGTLFLEKFRINSGVLRVEGGG